MNPIHLALDTSTARPLVALLRGTTPLTEWAGPAGTAHSETLLAGIDHCLAVSGVTLKELRFLSCGVGPGMFTGLRVGVATAQFLADSLGLKIAPVSSLLALALGVATNNSIKRIWALNDAKSGRVYALRIDASRVNPEILPQPEEELALDPERVKSELQIGDLLVGEGAAIYRDLWPEFVAGGGELFLSPKYVGIIGHGMFLKNEFLPPQKILPRYLKTSEDAQKHL